MATAPNASKTQGKRSTLANKALYAPKPRVAPARKAPSANLVPEAALNRITRRVLDELRTPGKVPSTVIRTALDEVLSLAELSRDRLHPPK